MSEAITSNQAIGSEAQSRAATRRAWVRVVLVWLARLAVATVFFAAAAPKIGDPAAFARTVGRYQILSEWLVHPMAVALPWLELTAGAALLIGSRWWRLAAGWLLIGLLAVFLVATFSAWSRGLSLSCGCFAAEGGEPIGPWTFIRNLGLIALTALAMVPGQGAASTEKQDAAKKSG